MDTHKYAFGPKGYSVCLFRTTDLRKYMVATSMLWQGGFYGTATLAGSRPGTIIAGTWAAIAKIGR